MSIVLLFLLFFTVVGSSVYFLNVNDYSQWITKQIKQSTGYDIRFEHFENNWLAEKQLSISGLALYQQEQRVVFIDRLELQVEELDLWQRQLLIRHIYLDGVEVDLQQPFITQESKVEVSSGATNTRFDLQNIRWESLHLGALRITALNASIQNEDKKIDLSDANFELNDLSIIDKQQLQIIPKNVDFGTTFKLLQFSDNQRSITLDNFKLSFKAFLSQRQAKLALAAEHIEVRAPYLVQLQSLDLALDLAEDKLSLQRFIVEAFSGSLSMQAEAKVVVSALPFISIKLQQGVLHSLVAKNMLLHIPTLVEQSGEVRHEAGGGPLAIDELLIKRIELDNISVQSEAKQLPLVLRSANAQLSNLYIVQNYQLLDVSKLNEQSANFSLMVDYLRWKTASIEKLSIVGSLKEDDPAWLLLQEIFVIN